MGAGSCRMGARELALNSMIEFQRLNQLRTNTWQTIWRILAQPPNGGPNRSVPFSDFDRIRLFFFSSMFLCFTVELLPVFPELSFKDYSSNA